MQKAALYGIIAAAVVAAGVGIAFAVMNSSNAGTSSQLASEQMSDNDNVRVIEHDLGETEITGTPQRIIALDWSASENLLSMGIQPIAVADLAGIKQYLRPEGLSPEIIDLGDAFEPNLERIVELEPDLIFAAKYANGGHYDELSSIAPTIIYDNAPPMDGTLTHLEALEQNIILVAEAANQREKGVELVQRLHDKYDEAAQKLKAAELNGAKFVFAAADPPYGEYTFSTLRLFDNTFFTPQILSEIGLENAVTEKYGLENWGMKVVGLEGLAAVDGPGVHLFYMHADDHDPFESEWKDNPVWTNLEIAKSGKVYPLPTLYVYGGVEKTEELIDRVVAALTSDSSQTRTITHAAGTTEVTGIPQRIIPLDTVSVELLLALGIEPVGLASVEDHKNWSPEISSEWPNAVDVGETWEPNFEVMAQLEPDLIIGMQAAHSEMYDDLSSIAPTILLDNWPQEGGPTMLEAVEQNTMLVADILGRHDDGAAFLESFRGKLEQNAQKLEAAGLDGAKFILADVWINEDTPILRLYVPNAQGSETLERMGLKNIVSPPEEFQRFGSIDSSLEALATLDGPDVHFLYLLVPGEDPFTSSEYWADNPVWNNLSFVEEGRVHSLGSINMFRGVLMLEKLADTTTSALTEE